MRRQEIINAADVQKEVDRILSQGSYDRVFVLTDTTTRRLCRNLLRFEGAQDIVIPPTDAAKTLDTLAQVWTELGQGDGTRHSLLFCLGGGMVTDLGGFAASTFKRGIDYVNIPTTLLAMVDASVGGKTGINFNGLKNEVGVFAPATHVLIHTPFLQTLDRENTLSGYAEMLKHSLISNEQMWADTLKFYQDYDQQSEHTAQAETAARLQKLVFDNVKVKERVVDEDPYEKGLRKALNLGHTVGHAFESFALASGHPVLHGYAVAWGLVCELWLSTVKKGFPTEKMRQTVRFIFDHYGRLPITCNDYDHLIDLMRHDKKNTAGTINFTLLGDIGYLHIDQTVTPDEIKEALDFYRENQ